MPAAGQRLIFDHVMTGPVRSDLTMEQAIAGPEAGLYQFRYVGILVRCGDRNGAIVARSSLVTAVSLGGDDVVGRHTIVVIMISPSCLLDQ